MLNISMKIYSELYGDIERVEEITTPSIIDSNNIEFNLYEHAVKIVAASYSNVCRKILLNRESPFNKDNPVLNEITSLKAKRLFRKEVGHKLWVLETQRDQILNLVRDIVSSIWQHIAVIYTEVNNGLNLANLTEELVLDYTSVARKTFLVEQLPDGALPIYDKDPDVTAYIVGEEGENILSVTKPKRVLFPLFEIAANPEIPLTQVLQFCLLAA